MKRSQAWEQIKALARADETPCAAVHAAAFTARYGKSTSRLDREQRMPAWARSLLFVALLGLALIVAACAGCVAPEAIEQARTEAANNHGHAMDTTLPLEARQVGADNTRAWRAQHLALTGDDVPGAETWPALPPELAPAKADRVETHDAHPTRLPCEVPGNGSGDCGCGAKSCRMPCTTCCGSSGCAPPPPDPSMEIPR